PPEPPAEGEGGRGGEAGPPRPSPHTGGAPPPPPPPPAGRGPGGGVVPVRPQPKVWAPITQLHSSSPSPRKPALGPAEGERGPGGEDSSARLSPNTKGVPPSSPSPPAGRGPGGAVVPVRPQPKVWAPITQL